MRATTHLVGAFVIAIAAVALGKPAPAEIVLLRTPASGIQPQTAVDGRGVLHMIYFTGDAAGGNIEYVTRQPGADRFSAPIRVNSQPDSALAVGTVRGPQMALGADGRVYVIWFGSSKARPRGPGGATPVLYARLNAAKTAFTPQRNLMQYARGVDGGLSIAADARGNVYAVWHAMGAEPGEAHRRVYLARSTDSGADFAREVPISPASLGACGCCGMKAFVDSRGALFILYRAAAQGVHRDMTLLTSTDHGRTFRGQDLSNWYLKACPMSTDALNEGGGAVLAAWERAGEVYFDHVNLQTLTASPALAAPGKIPDRKHPAIAANARGETLLAWTDGTGWMQGGSLAWQLFAPDGKPVGSEGHAPGVPVWGLPSVFVNHNGSFTIVY